MALIHIAEAPHPGCNCNLLIEQTTMSPAAADVEKLPAKFAIATFWPLVPVSCK